MSKIALLFIVAFLYSIYAILMIGPVYGFYIYEIIYFLNPNSRWWFSSLPSFSYSFIVVVLMMISFLITKAKHNINTIDKTPAAKWFLALFISYCLVTLIAVNGNMHNRFFIELVKLFITMYIAYRILDSEKKLQIALYCFLIGAAYLGYEALNVGRNSYGRVEGIGMVDSPEANTMAAAMAPAVPLLIYFGWQLEWKYKLGIGLLAAFIINGLVLVNSRGAFLGVIVGSAYLLAYMFFSRYKLPKQKLMLTLIILTIIGGTLRLVDDSFWQRMETIQTTSSADSEGSGGRRINFWLATFDLVEDYPFGVGIFGYETLSVFYLKDESYFTEVDGVKMRSVHSIWFQALSEVGWHGFTFFILLLISIKRHLNKAKSYLIAEKNYRIYYLGIALEGAMLAFLVSGSFINVFRVQMLYWLMLFCICYSVTVLNNKDKKLNLIKE
jgi:probable O-glycosylation ligase (exosortase A-associated)